jgi:hypothetical protein
MARISSSVIPICVSECQIQPYHNFRELANAIASALVDQMVVQMRQGAFFGTSPVRKGALPGNPVFFYTGLQGTPQQQVGWGRIWLSRFIGGTGQALGINSYDSFNTVPRSWIQAQTDLLMGHPELWYPGDTPRPTRTLKAFSDCYCQALAAAAQATYALLGIPDGETWRTDS